MSVAIRSRLEQKLEIKDDAPASSPQELKLIILHNKTLSEDQIAEINTNMFSLVFNYDMYSSISVDVLFRSFQCIIIDVSDKNNRLYYSQCQANLSKMSNVRVLFHSMRGKSVDINALKAEWKANYVIKYLPSLYKDSSDFINKLLYDHIGSIGVSLFAKLKAYVLEKISCIFG
jgi:hypothetical protein